MAQEKTPVYNTNMVPNTGTPPTAVGTADYVSLDLPSRFAYYSFKDLYIKPFRIPHLAKMAKIDETSSMQLLAETVSSVLMTPDGHQNIAFHLSMPDLNAVMFWLRLNSFAKKSMKVKSQCQNPKHIVLVEEGVAEMVDGVPVIKKMAPETLTVETVYTESQMAVNYLDKVPDPEHYHIMIEGERLNLRPERVQDAIEFLDAPEWKDEEFQYKTRVAAVLDLENFIPTRKWTLHDKVKFVDDVLSNDDALLALEFNDLTSEYGLVETVPTKCMGCGASGQVRLTIDARTFLTPDFG
jgi:hypothetical protein